MDKKIVIIITVVVVIGLAVAGYFYWQKFKGPALTSEQQALDKASEAAGKITESASQGTLPSMNIQTNPLEKSPDINPAGQTNPFKNIKTNPFE